MANSLENLTAFLLRYLNKASQYDLKLTICNECVIESITLQLVIQPMAWRLA